MRAIAPEIRLPAIMKRVTGNVAWGFIWLTRTLVAAKNNEALLLL
jgi:hypothetical protein